MGDTLRYAERIGLAEMAPRGDLSSTGYALAKPGTAYLVLQPSEQAEPFTVALEAGAYSVEWHSVNRRETAGAGKLTVERTAARQFTAPFGPAGPVVLYLEQICRASPTS